MALSLGTVLSGCEYEYSADRWDDETSSVAASPPTDAALPQDPHRNEPVSGEELDDWVDDVLPDDAQGHVFQTSFGSVAAGAVHTESTTQLPGGTYSLTLACRSTDRVSFTVSNGNESLVDLSLRCGTPRVNVVQLAADAVLHVQVTGPAAANFAYRVSRI
jgi:hypothetical protein